MKRRLLFIALTVLGTAVLAFVSSLLLWHPLALATEAAGPTAGREFPTQFVLDALAQSVDETGWAHLVTFGHYLTKLQPDFDARLFGHRKMSDLVRARSDLFIVEEREIPGSTQKVLYLRAK